MTTTPLLVPGLIRRVRREADLSQRDLAALLRVDQSLVARWETGALSPSVPHLEELAEKLQVSFADRRELLSHPKIMEEVRRRVSETTSKLAHHEQIRDLRILMEEFTQDNGLLTPTLKVRRREVEKRFAEVIDDMYAKYPGLAEARARVADVLPG